jgi:hypothetical protein
MTQTTRLYDWDDRLLVFLIRGDFARGQRRHAVEHTWIGNFASGQAHSVLQTSSGLR